MAIIAVGDTVRLALEAAAALHEQGVRGSRARHAHDKAR